jgi:hypothetical protein
MNLGKELYVVIPESEIDPIKAAMRDTKKRSITEVKAMLVKFERWLDEQDISWLEKKKSPRG